jgi:hypothetical protein
LREFIRPQHPLSNILIYGPSSAGKSTRVAEAIAYVHDEWGLRGRVVGADGGGTQNAIGALVDAGIADYWAIDQWTEQSIFTTYDLASKGWWPEDHQTPNSKIVPNVREFMQCPACLGDSGSKGLTMAPICASCKKPFVAGSRLKLVREPINGLQDVGVLAFEGLTAFGQNLLMKLAEVNPDGGRSITDSSVTEQVRISAPGLQHYGDAQNRLARCVSNNRMVPVPIIIWTALESRGEDEGKPVFGPKGPGKALATQSLQWYTDVLHLDMVPKVDTRGLRVKGPEGIEILERKLFLEPHFPTDAPNQLFRCKVTSAGPCSGLPPVMDPDLRGFFKKVEEAKAKSREYLLPTKPTQVSN